MKNDSISPLAIKSGNLLFLWLPMKLPSLLLLLAAFTILPGCVSREKKSTARTYVGDSPTIVYGPRESAGGPITAH
ncbi:MAG: hypothetical protein JWL90_4230 [Chthoniobacteraceae bacterium]|nr:hypothetical protein [Chthoniobacteraceae bacterium]